MEKGNPVWCLGSEDEVLLEIEGGYDAVRGKGGEATRKLDCDIPFSTNRALT